MSEEGDEGAGGGAGLGEHPHGASGARPCGPVAASTSGMLRHTWQQSKVIRVCVCVGVLLHTVYQNTRSAAEWRPFGEVSSC